MRRNNREIEKLGGTLLHKKTEKSLVMRDTWKCHVINTYHQRSTHRKTGLFLPRHNFV